MARNPLIGFLDTSKKPPRNPGTNGVEERQINPDKPTLEYYEGDNNAWRGTEMHGVKATDHAKAYDPKPVGDNAPVVSPMPEAKIVEPIDVRIVNEYARELETGQLFTVPVQDIPRRVVGQHDGRSRVLIRNTGANTSVVYLSTHSTVSAMTSFRLEIGAELSLHIETELWAVCDFGNSTYLQVVDEYPVRLPNANPIG